MNSPEDTAGKNLSSLPGVMFEHENVTKDLQSLHFQNLSDWGPKRDPLYIVVPFTILFATIFLTGLIGNISTCIVIARNRSMHTATNYYLFSLAISDLLLLISGLPQEMYYIWSKYPYVFGETMCVLQGFAAETSANATVLTITAFTVERYVAICHPFLSHTMSKLSRAVKLVIIIWTFAICLAIPQAMAFGIVYDDSLSDQGDDDHYICNVKRIVIPHAFLISTVLFFVTPMSLITVLYILIGLQLRQSTVGPVRGGSVKMNNLVRKRSSIVTYTGKSNQSALITNDPESANLQLSPQEEDDRKNCPNQTQASSQHVVKMLVAVVVAFFICWAPFHAQRLLAIYGQSDSSDMVTTFSVLTYISGVLYYISTTINPVLYHIMSHKFRMAFKETYARCPLKRRRQTRIPLRYSVLSRRSSQDKGNSNLLVVGNLFDSKSEQPLSRHFKRKKRILYQNEKNIICFNSELNLRRDSSDARLQCNLKIKPDKGVRLKNGSLCNNYESCNALLLEDNRRKLEEIETFREEILSIKTIRRVKDVNVIGDNNRGSRRRSTSYKLKIEANNTTSINKMLKKSVTMPNMGTAYVKLHLENGRILYNDFLNQI